VVHLVSFGIPAGGSLLDSSTLEVKRSENLKLPRMFMALERERMNCVFNRKIDAF
jgi:hypothetical protein